jgi:Cof subfamily protein (haloacid dehalogenase superfamily)
MYRLLAIDLDGTLLTQHNSVTLRTQDVLQRAVAMGLRIVVATGRVPYMFRSLVESLPLNAPQITSNGAMIVDIRDDSVWQELFIPTESLLPLLETLHSLDLLCCYYTRDHLYVDAELARLHQSRSNHQRRTNPAVSVTDDLAELYLQPCLKLAAYGEAGTLHEKRQQLASLFGKQIYITQTAHEWLEFLHPDVSKANALKTILQTYGISAEEVIAFGDNPNDIEMLHLAGMGIAMANAHEEVKAAADYITLSNMEDGVAVALENFLFNDNSQALVEMA